MFRSIICLHKRSICYPFTKALASFYSYMYKNQKRASYKQNHAAVTSLQIHPLFVIIGRKYFYIVDLHDLYMYMLLSVSLKVIHQTIRYRLLSSLIANNNFITSSYNILSEANMPRSISTGQLATLHH